MSSHLARRAFVCLFGSLLLSATASYAQSSPFVYQSIGPSQADDPIGGFQTGFGQAVGVEGLTTVVGVPLYGPASADGIPNGQGQVAVFTADTATGEVWTRTGTIANPNPQVSNFFGQALALSHDRLVVEATGQLYVFDKHGSGANETWRLVGSAQLPTQTTTTSYRFNPVLAFDGATVAVVVSQDNYINGVNNFLSFIYLYEVGREGHISLRDKLGSPNSNCDYGSGVGVENDTLVVGCPAGTGPTPYPPGEAYVYARRGDHWELRQTLAGTTAPGAGFGTGVAIHKNVILIGAAYENDDAGVGYLYQRKRDKDCDTWTLSQSVQPNPALGLVYGGLGTTIALNDQYAAFGAPLITLQPQPVPGVTFIFKWQGDQLVYDDEMPPGADGTSLAMSRTRLVIGANKFFSPYIIFEGATIIDFDPKTTTSSGSTSP